MINSKLLFYGRDIVLEQIDIHDLIRKTISYRGYNIKQICELLGFNYKTFYSRLKRKRLLFDEAVRILNLLNISTGIFNNIYKNDTNKLIIFVPQNQETFIEKDIIILAQRCMLVGNNAKFDYETSKNITVLVYNSENKGYRLQEFSQIKFSILSDENYTFCKRLDNFYELIED